ncbi:sensor histidine kinase GlnK [Propionigenium maris DSM 9537]|uniref:histidine kinase n=1 Tax=Propionigenium maris DSM 9537 TaxID=1123000 RepID=A0A9W6GN98_9FUSO|nr:ATP-binding protein [Propionigenium maris]GLI57045.1 sensor histidine kinase GlnK [Propionigenium maris DSM 9537]
MKKKFKLPIYLISILIFSELFFYPVNIRTRVSIGIVVLHFILLVEGGGFYKKLIPLSALAIFTERILYYRLFGHLSFGEAFTEGYPILFYYMVYLSVTALSKFQNRGLSQKIILLFAADTLSNTMELSLRGEITPQNIKYILLVSLTRVVAAFIIYLIYKYRMMIMADDLHQKKYISLNLLVSSLEAELFYLKKSTVDIEDVMQRAHKLYLDSNETARVKEEALEIARDVHEIKKDYMRIISGMERNLSNFKRENSLPLSKLCEIISANTRSYIESVGKEIDFSMVNKLDTSVRDYHKLFIIINNLVINAIEALGKKGWVEVRFRADERSLFVEVEDNGRGISEKNIPLLFKAGFTTKYNKETGEMNTGLGLSHVENILETIDGNIKVESILTKGTKFIVTIPLESL